MRELVRLQGVRGEVGCAAFLQVVLSGVDEPVLSAMTMALPKTVYWAS